MKNSLIIILLALLLSSQTKIEKPKPVEVLTKVFNQDCQDRASQVKFFIDIQTMKGFRLTSITPYKLQAYCREGSNQFFGDYFIVVMEK